jgi:hypothetical protein
MHKELCYHWSNISPLKTFDNRSKSSKICTISIEKQIRKLNLFVKNHNNILTIFDKIVDDTFDTAGIEKSILQQQE